MSNALTKDIQGMGAQCSIDVEWNSNESSGNVILGSKSIGYGTLHAADRDRNGLTPEALLIAAISTSYSIALSDIVRAASLPQTRISVRASGTIVSSCGAAQFDRVVLSPTIQGADLSRRDAYEKAATAARDGCLIGRSMRGNVAYVIGKVQLPPCTD
jgi:organic hydroperoxide reductase OsmC/OhrA